MKYEAKEVVARIAELLKDIEDYAGEIEAMVQELSITAKDLKDEIEAIGG